jgi:SAM-dependent methyltransferase
MSHQEQLDFIERIKSQVPHYFSNTKVLEVGSLDINGSIRQFFEDCDYIGIDVGEGKGVDVVCGGQEYDAPDDSFDVSVSCECFEHNPYWVDTFNNMIRMTRPGGLVIMTCATTGRAEHGTRRKSPKSSPLTCAIGWDYYKNLTEKDFRDNIEDIDNKFSMLEFICLAHTRHKDLHFWGVVK